MTKIKTSELAGPQLDWAVAKCEGKSKFCEIHAGNVLYGTVASGFIQYSPSTDWSQGGPLLEREKLALTYDAHWHYDPTDPEDNGERWYCELTEPNEGSSHGRYGPTPLVAAMRCYVASKLGAAIDVPEGLA